MENIKEWDPRKGELASIDRGIIDQDDAINKELRDELLENLSADKGQWNNLLQEVCQKENIAPSFAIDLIILNVLRPRYEQAKLDKVFKADKKK